MSNWMFDSIFLHIMFLAGGYYIIYVNRSPTHQDRHCPLFFRRSVCTVRANGCRIPLVGMRSRIYVVAVYILTSFPFLLFFVHVLFIVCQVTCRLIVCTVWCRNCSTMQPFVNINDFVVRGVRAVVAHNILCRGCICPCTFW